MRVSKWWVIGLVALMVLLGACGDDTGKSGKTNLEDVGVDAPDGGDTDSVEPYACEPDPQLVGQKISCVRDEHCPCGTSCWLGQCQARCEKDDECADDEYCDGFGQCRATDDAATVHLPERHDLGRLEPRQKLATLTDARPLASILVRAVDGPVVAGRVGAGEGLQVAVTDGDAPGDADFAAEVLIDQRVEADGTVTLWARRDPGHTDDEPLTNQVGIWDSSGHHTSVTVTERTSLVGGATDGPELVGTYTGVARLVARGSVGGLGLNITTPRREQSVPITAQIFDTGSGMRLVIEDNLRVLHPQGEWIGELSADAQDLALPAFEALALDQIALSNSQVIATPSDMRVDADPSAADWDGVLRFGFDLRYAGITDTAAIPMSRWMVTLSRTGDLPDGADAPEAQSDAQLAYDTAQLADTEFVAETGMATVASAYPDFDSKWEAIRQVADRSIGGTDMGVCVAPYLPFVSDDDRSAYYNSFYYSIFPDVYAANVGALNQPYTITPVFAYDRAPNSPGGWTVNNDKTKTVSELAGAGVPLLSEIFAGVSDQSLELWSAQVPVASGFYHDVTPTTPSGFRQAPEITLADGTTVNHALPCDIDLSDSPDTVAFDEGYGSSVFDVTLDVPNQRFDFCQEAADRLDCRIVDVTSVLTPEERDMYPAQYIDFDVTMQPGDSFSYQIRANIPDVRFSKVCIPPSLPKRCAEGLACENANTGSGSLEIEPLSDSGQSASSGDLTCGESGRHFAFEMDEAGLTADTLVEDCVADSEAIERVLASPTGTTERDKLAAMGWYNSEGCFRPIQLLGTVGRATEAVRYWRDETGAEATLADLIAMRMLQRWTDAHAFIASEATHSTPFAHLDATVNSDSLDGLEARLDQSLRAWRLLMHPRVATALMSLSPEALRHPDYRQMVGAGFTEEGYHRQDEGLVVSMAELLDAQLRLGQAIAERYAYEGAQEVPASLVRLQQAHLVAESLIQALTERSRDVDGNYGEWDENFRAVERRVMGSWVTLLNRVDGLLEGRNPLGIEDTDLPLYFRDFRVDATSRFTAITRFLLGQTNGSEAWAASLVRDAVDAYDTAKDAYLDESSRAMNEEATATAKALRVADEKTDFGLMMIDFCGSEAFGDVGPGDVHDSIDQATFDASTCWFRSERTECAPGQASSEDAVTYSLCTSALAALGPNGIGRRPAYATVNVQGKDFRYYAMVRGWEFDNPVLGSFYEQILENWTGFPAQINVTMRTTAGACFRTSEGTTVCARDEVDRPVNVTYDPQTHQPYNPCKNTAVPNFPGILPEIEQLGDGSYEAVCAPNQALGFEGTTLRMPLSGAAAKQLRGTYTNGVLTEQIAGRCREFVPGHDPTPVARWADAPQSCYGGSVGAEVYATRTLVTDIEVARDAVEQHTEAYRIAMQSCFIQQQGNQQLMEAQRSFDAEMNHLQTAKQIADTVATWAYSTGDCLSEVSGADEPWDYGLAAGTCAAYAVGSAADTASIAYDADMQRAERAHETTMMGIEQSTEEARCFKEAELELVGLRAAYLEIQRAQQELASSYLQAQHAVEVLEAEYDAGLIDVETAETAAMFVPSQSPWYNEELADYERKLRLARRGAYLAVRAVEYEFQMTSSYRSDVLLAETPLELEQVLTELRQEANTNSVAGARPAELTEVVSLKDHLLQLGDRSESTPAGWHALSDTERFRKMLVDPAYEVYEDGVFIGRRIPFNIAPLSVLDRGEFQGVPIVSDNSCAERLWSLNVTIQGEDGEVIRGVSPTINLEVRKRNTFFSNLCDAARGDFQVASVRPARNLFREPGVGEGISGITGQSEADGFSKARVQARLNIAPQEFASDSYTDGASAELAARGLFGEYELFIPATSLAPASNGLPSGDGLVLNQVDDILLRVDYVSVAR
ncbi:hypothetical protein FIV42_18000 [Persicimonas caeni]|uniref:Uncharacterized protein n=1 Tax=Persicimonas caeni TaxID=2292766 RepID=A0A4Y6PW67_PERCE|nr:hypothetical protein [Persicimonas caeni]QDG52558.1 hypothetical protein FIV42_18000 [Persicimonas caeni]QED33780.1 hypothetical protein FRD00_17995 [Persicimonas caeni]